VKLLWSAMRVIMADNYGNPWPKYRVYPTKILPPLRAVRAKCLDCCCEVAEEVRLCPAEGCSLWHYRFGAYPENHQGPKTVLRPIKLKCKDCAPEPREAVKTCKKKCCPLWPYRLGTNPKLKGKKRGLPPPKSAQFQKSNGRRNHQKALSEDMRGKDQG
jgi:hypothetical protein